MSTTFTKDTYRTVATQTSGDDLEITVRASVERSALFAWTLYLIVGIALSLVLGRPGAGVGALLVVLHMAITGTRDDVGRRIVHRRLVVRGSELLLSSRTIPWKLHRALDLTAVERFEASCDDNAIEAVLENGDRRSIALGHLEEGSAEAVVRALNKRLG